MWEKKLRFVVLYEIPTLFLPKLAMTILNCNSQEEVYILKYRRCGEALGNDKAETKF